MSSSKYQGASFQEIIKLKAEQTSCIRVYRKIFIEKRKKGPDYGMLKFVSRILGISKTAVKV